MGVIISRDDSGNIKVLFPYNPAYVYENSFQKTMKSVARLADIDKSGSVHTFLHCFATHLSKANYDRERAPYRVAHRDLCSFLSRKPRSLGIHIRTVQELLGHKDVSATMIYTHVLNKPVISVRSPLDG